jgi:hypothetical protein
VLACAALWGVSCIQTWYYFRRYPKDFWYVKLLVVVTMIVDTIHQILITHTIYFYLVTNYAYPPALASMIWSMNLQVVFNGMLDLLVQGFLTYRVYLLSYKNRLLAGAFALMVLGLFSIQLAYTILALQLVPIVELARLKALAMSVDIMAATLDLLLAVTLCYLLHTSRTGFKTTDNTISRIMLFTVNTGLMTSICATTALITYLVFRNALIYVAFYFLGGRLYTNSLLATLNSRPISHATDDYIESMNVSLGPVTTSKATGTTQASENNITIKFDNDSHEFSVDNKSTVDTAV